MTTTDVISFKPVETSNGRKVWFVTVNNRILGDSRGYDTPAEAREAALADVDSAKPNEDGTRSRIYRPGW